MPVESAHGEVSTGSGEIGVIIFGLSTLCGHVNASSLSVQRAKSRDEDCYLPGSNTPVRRFFRHMLNEERVVVLSKSRLDGTWVIVRVSVQSSQERLRNDERLSL